MSEYKEIRKTFMLEMPKIYNNEIDFAEFIKKQIIQFIECDENSFYKGKCSNELVILRKVLYELLEKIQEIRKNDEIYEMPVFNNIMGVIDFALSLKLNKATLGEVCNIVERLLGYIMDYDILAPRKYHFPEIRDKVKDLLYTWRKKERKSWRGLVYSFGLEPILKDIEN